MGKGKKGNKKVVVFIITLIAVFVIAFCYLTWQSSITAIQRCISSALITGLIGGILLIVNKLLLTPKKVSSAPAPELLDRLEPLLEEKAKQAQTIEEKERIIRKKGQYIDEIQKKIKETEDALKERHVSVEALTRFVAGDYAEAEALFTKELEDGTREREEGTKKAANAAYCLGNIKYTQLRLDEAHKYYQQASEFDPKNSLYLNGLGVICDTLGKYQEAIKVYEQILLINRETCGKEHPKVATSLNNLGAAWKYLGKHEKAIEFFEQALPLWQATYGKIHPHVATCLNNLGMAWYSLGKYDKAEGFYEQALSIDREVYGKRHPDVARDLNNLGSAWNAHGMFEKAIGFYEQALSIDREVYGERHPNVAVRLNNLGMSWKALGKFETAREYLSGAYEMWGETLGEDHPNTRKAKGNLDTLPK